MRGTEYHHVAINGVGTDGLPIHMSYRDHWNGKIGVSTFTHMRASAGTQWEKVRDGRPVQLQRDLS